MIERFRPRSLSELVRAVRETAVGGTVLSLVGGKTKLGWLLAGPQTEAVIDFRDLAGVVHHAPGDMVVTVQAGTRLADLQSVLAEKGQRLAVNPPLGDDREATVGGIFSADDWGPSKLAFGSLRNLCMGAIFVLPDGTVARSGSSVIKNVAGYNLCRLYCGAHGTLGAVARLTFRLHPLPRHESTLRAPLTSASGIALALELGLDPRVSPTSVTYQEGALWVRFEGHRDSVSAQLIVAREFLQSRTESVAALEAEQSRAEWQDLVEARRARPGETALACSTLPSSVSELVRQLERLCAERSLEVRMVADPLLGCVLAFLAQAEAKVVAPIVTALRAELKKGHGHVRIRERVGGLDALVDPHDPIALQALTLMRSVKERFDPVGRCMPGRHIITL